MFSRRRTPSAQRPIDHSTHLAATTAASSAFRNNNRSNTSLSSAAAAAALRSHTTSPEPVGSIQTKRMVRRGSTSSQGSTSVLGGSALRPGLQRNTSNGSMTERTFRTESPVPRNGAVSPSPMGTRGPARPASSMATTRVTSPPPANGKRSSSADALNPPPASSRQAKRLSNVAETDDELDKAHADFARNFSRRLEGDEGAPESKAAAAPATGAANKYTRGVGSWFKQGSGGDVWANSRPKSPENGHSPMPSSLRSSSASSPAAAGSHLARANVSSDRVYGIAPGTSYNSPPRVYDPNSRSFVQRAGGLPAEPDSPTGAPGKVETVYDPNSRTFVPKREASRDRIADPAPPTTFVSAANTLNLKKQRAAAAAAPVPVIEPPPKNPARFAQDPSASTSSRAAPALHKQPSVVHEDPDAEQQAEAAVSIAKADKTVRPVSALPAKTYVAPEAERQRSSSLDVPTLGLEASGRGRVPSQSPQRAHFSPSPILRPERHVPPPRDVSPAKSAMKQSPASSIRTGSPIATFSPLGLGRVHSPASETSESPSLPIQDGVAKKKKSVRVSFDEHAQEIAPSTVLASIAAGALATTDEDDADSDVAMRPRPALPSFGSVRRDRIQPEPAEKVTEMPPARHGTSSDHAIAGILRSSANEPLPPKVTSKDAAGYASDESSDTNAAAATSAAVPSAPADTPSEALLQPPAADPTVRDFAASPKDDVDVPSIALFPPTPRLDDEANGMLTAPQDQSALQNRNSMEGIDIPGGWNKDPEEQSTVLAAATAKPTPEIFDGQPLQPSESSAIPVPVAPVQLTSSPLPLSDIDEDSDAAEFSDALEDPSDLEDEGEGGFASLDAIVESPIVVPSSPQAKGRPVEPESPTTPSAQQALKWDAATAYWSQLSQEKRAQLEREHLSSDDEAHPAVVAPKKTTKPRPALTDAPSSSFTTLKKPEHTQPAFRKTMRAGPGPVVAADPSESTVHMRRSMRDGGARTLSSRQSVEAPRPMSRSSFQSDARSEDYAAPTMRTKRASQQSRPEMPMVSARLQKELQRAEDSDSESSFKKRRAARAKVDGQGRYSMKQSMRGSAAAAAPIPQAPPSPVEVRPSSPTTGRSGGRFGRLRSMSPSFSRNKSPPPAPVPEPPARSTLRGTSAPRPTQSALRQPAAAARRYKSRFADSDDEDDDRAPARPYRSRFVDSDEDEPTSPAVPSNLTPVRGIPRRSGQEDGDSTDLEDEDEEAKPVRTMRKPNKKTGKPDSSEVDRVMNIARRNVEMSKTPGTAPTMTEGSALHKGSMRPTSPEPVTQPMARPSDISFAPPEFKRRGFMGSILRRNRNSSSSVQLVSSLPPSAVATPEKSRVVDDERLDTPPQNMSSPPRPIGGKLRKNSNPPRILSRGSSYLSDAGAAPATATTTTTQSPADASKLPDSLLDSWNLPESLRPTMDDRPSTSDGFSPEAIRLAQTLRPDLAPRSQSHQLSAGGGRKVQIQAGEEGSEPGERPPNAAYSQRTGKKKKFGALRRAFGLHD